MARKLGSIVIHNGSGEMAGLDLEALVENCLKVYHRSCEAPCLDCGGKKDCLRDIRAILAVVEREAKRV